MVASKYDERAVHELFDDALRRGAKDVERRATIDEIMAQAYGPHEALQRRQDHMLERFMEGHRPKFLEELTQGPDVALATVSPREDPLAAFRPDDSVTSMPPREFMGPGIGAARFFPRRAVSLFTALGGTGKTTALIALAAHIAAGKDWGMQKLVAAKVLMIFVEEDQEELTRKFAATTHDWDPAARALAADNMRLISLVGRDPRLTTRIEGSIVSSEMVTEITGWALMLDAGVIVLDHLQGFADGDLNNSDTATMLAQTANQIVAKTNAAVVFAAHVNKSQIRAEAVDAGFTTGNLGFENAARQVTGVIKVPSADIDRLGIDDPENVVKVAQPKNSYGPAGQECFFKKEYVPAFHTTRVVPYSNPRWAVMGVMSKADRLRDEVLRYLKQHPGSTKNKLDSLSGASGSFRASKADVRRVLTQLTDEGAIRLRPVSKEEKTTLGLPQQTKEVLEVVD